MNRKISLAGDWHFALDPDRIGLRDGYSTGVFGGSMRIPGSVSEERLSSEITERLSDAPTDPYKYEGNVWLGRKITLSNLFESIPEPTVFLHIERTRRSAVFVDGVEIGRRDSLSAPHVYNLTEAFHRARRKGKDVVVDLVILLDNTNYPGPGGNMTSPGTQTNWIGIIGEIYLMIRNRVFLSHIEVFPDPATGRVRITADINGHGGSKNPDGSVNPYVLKSAAAVKQSMPDKAVEATLQPGPMAGLSLIVSAESGDGMSFPKRRFNVPAGDKLDITYDVGINYRVWTDTSPSTYELKLTLMNENNIPDVYFKPFGFRDLTVRDGKFFAGGAEVFFRGRCDALIFPLTGYAPCDISKWMHRLRIMKRYGFNLIRFPACCPPEAAFFAADILGIYLCPELPIQGFIPSMNAAATANPEPVTAANPALDWLKAEGERILRTYGSHPSFAMFSLGGEIKISPEITDELIKHFKNLRPDIFFCSGADNIHFTGTISESDDFIIASRLSKDAPLRGSFAASDPPAGHMQTIKPSSDFVYNVSLGFEKLQAAANENEDPTTNAGEAPEANANKAPTTAQECRKPRPPVVAHEIGQYAMMPRISAMQAMNPNGLTTSRDIYYGVMKPFHFAAAADRMDDAGLLPKAADFFRDSGLFAAQCYKAEIETSLRSEDLSGFHLMDICDNTGGGGMYIGILNVFGENKGLMSEEQWRQFCAPLTIAAVIPKFVYISEDYFTMKVIAANFTGKAVIGSDVVLKFVDSDTLEELAVYTERMRGNIPTGRTEIARFEFKMPFFSKPHRVIMTICCADIKNEYTLWCYPDRKDGYREKGGVTVTSDLPEALTQLESGNNVLFFPEHIQRDFAIPGEYAADFKNFARVAAECAAKERFAPTGTMGLSIKNNHPALKQFPCETYSTPQWYDIVTASCSLMLDGTDFDPIVSTIDNVFRNHKLALIFEAKVLSGKLLVCMANLYRLQNNVPAMQLAHSLLQYMNTPAFDPAKTLSEAKMRLLFTY